MDSGDRMKQIGGEWKKLSAREKQERQDRANEHNANQRAVAEEGIHAPPRANLDVDAGDAIVFDSRTQHAGGANGSQRARPILYLVFARPWFDEAMHRRLVGGAGGGDGVQRLFPEFSASGA